MKRVIVQMLVCRKFRRSFRIFDFESKKTNVYTFSDPEELGLHNLQTIDDPDNICISQRSFAIGIAIAGLILMLVVVAAILALLAKRRHKSISTTGSSIYSGPYTNTAYSHSS